jgi:hypothetical protein
MRKFFFVANPDGIANGKAIPSVIPLENAFFFLL